MNIGMVLSGGTGTRFRDKLPKQYHKINGKEVISFSYEALKNSTNIDKIVVVASAEEQQRLKDFYSVDVVIGGDSRNKSLKNGLNYIKKNYDCENIIILEAARPMVTAKIVDEYIEKLGQWDAVITGQKIVDSLGCFDNHYVDRSKYYLIQAPEAFKFSLLYSCFKEDAAITATNQQLPADSKVYINFDFQNNQKITYFEDLKYCEDLISRRN